MFSDMFSDDDPGLRHVNQRQPVSSIALPPRQDKALGGVASALNRQLL